MPEQDELTVDLPSEGQSVSVDVEAQEEISEDQEVHAETEHEDYSKKVKRRIDKLTKKAREAERQKPLLVMREIFRRKTKNLKIEFKALTKVMSQNTATALQRSQKHCRKTWRRL